MDKLQAIEFKDGEILIYQDTPAHHDAHDLADFEADKTLGTVKRVFTLINANEAQAEIQELKMFIAKYIHWDILSDAGTERARQIHREVFPENY